MYRSELKTIAVACLITAMWPGREATAQATQTGGLSRVARYAGTLVWVVDRADGTLLARVVSATDTELGVTVGGTARTFQLADIKRVYVTGDTVRDGTLIGAAIGVPLGTLACQGSSSACDIAGHAVAGAVLYGGIGAMIDWLHHGQTVIYRAPGG